MYRALARKVISSNHLVHSSRTYANAWSTIAITWATDIDRSICFVVHNLHLFWKNEHCDLCARARALLLLVNTSTCPYILLSYTIMLHTVP